MNQGIKLYEEKSFSQAAKSFKKAIELKPDYIEAYYNLGESYWILKRYEEASDAFKKILELSPESSFAKRAKDELTEVQRISRISEERKLTPQLPATAEILLPSDYLLDLQFGTPQRKVQAAQKLGELKEKSAVPLLTKIIKDKLADSNLRRTSLKNLAQIVSPESASLFREILEREIQEKGLVIENGMVIRKKMEGAIYPPIDDIFCIALALGKLGDKSAIPFLVARLNENYTSRPQDIKDITERVSAVETLGLLGAKDEIDFLSYLAKRDKYSEVRESAKHALLLLQ